MTAPSPSVSAELKVLMRRLKLGRLLDTLPERLALARQHDLTHVQLSSSCSRTRCNDVTPTPPASGREPPGWTRR